MDEQQTQTFLLIAVVAAIVFAYLYFSQRSRIDKVVHEKVEQWRNRELQTEQQRLLAGARQQAALDLEDWKRQQTKSIRSDAIQRSQAVTRGKVAEHIVPYFPEFEFDPKDVRFLGTPVDFIAFDGLSDGGARRVVFVEVKTGTSQLTTRERSVRAAVESGRVEWRELRLAIR